MAKRLEHYTKPLVEKIKDLEARVVTAEREIREIKTTKMTFGGVAQKTRIFETGATLAAPHNNLRARTPSPAASRPAATPAPRPPQRPRRPSITSYTEDIPIDEIRRSFRDSKKEVRVSPVTIKPSGACMWV